jgi:6-phosphogluconolactonase
MKQKSEESMNIHLHLEHFPSRALSRRSFLKTISALPLTHSALAAVPAASRKQFAYVGTYTGAVGNGGSGEGIYLYEVHPQTGALALIKLASKVPSPSCVTIHPSQKFLYAGNEITSFQDGSEKGGSVTAYAIDRSSGELKLLNTVASKGAGPAHISVDHSGKYLFVANYDSGSIGVLPIGSDGRLGTSTEAHKDTGSVGPKKSSNAPTDGFSISGHDNPHAHMIQASPDNKFVLYTDLGQDRIYVSAFDPASGKLTPAAAAYASLPPGDGPRHFAFHPNSQWLYSIQEEASTIVFFHYDPKSGELKSEQTVSTLPQGFHGTNFTSEILISSDGRFLYAANRLHDTIATFAIATTGRLTLIGESSTLGDYPAAFNIDPGGNFLYACNLRSDCIACFRIDRRSGLLKFTGNYTGVGSPGSIVFLT